MRRRVEQLGFVAIRCVIETITRLGLAARVTGDARHLLGRPRGMRAFVKDYAEEFQGDSGISS